MSARLLASCVWMPLLLFPPLFAGIQWLADLMWPSIEPFRSLAAVNVLRLPLVVAVVAGYGITSWAAGFLLRELSLPSAWLKRRRYLVSIGLPTTLVWLVAAALLQILQFNYILVAAVVMIGFSPAPSAEPEEEEETFPLPSPPDPLPEPDAEDTVAEEDPETLVREFSWLFNREPYRRDGPTQRFSFSLGIPRSEYEASVAADHSVRADADYVRFANAQLDHRTVSAVGGWLRQFANENRLDELAEIHLAMAFTLSMPYAYDSEEYAREYPKYPVEMLGDQKGDCEDFSILCGAILHRLGHDVGLVLMAFSDLDHGHAALGVVPPIPVEGAYIRHTMTGKKYFYCEVTPAGQVTTNATTAVQWWLGQSFPATAINLRVFPVGE